MRMSFRLSRNKIDFVSLNVYSSHSRSKTKKESLIQRRRKEVWDGAKPQGSGERESSSGAFFKVGTCKFYAFLVVFHTFSPIYACFFCACRDHSTKSAKWGHLIPFALLVCKWRGNCPLCPPAPPPMV